MTTATIEPNPDGSIAGRYGGDGLRARLDQVHREYLLRVLARGAGSQPEHAVADDPLLDSALAMESAATGQLRIGAASEEVEQALALAAEIFEYLGDLRQGDLDRVRELNLYVHASVCYSLAHYESSSAVLAGRVCEKVERLASMEEPESYGRFLLDFDSAILSFLRRDMRQARPRADGLLRFVRGAQGLLRRYEDPRELAARTDLLRFTGAMADFLLTGRQEHRQEAERHVHRARTLLAEGGGAFLYWLATRLELVAHGMVERSVWNLLGDLPERRPRYLHALVNQARPVLELWTSQVRALHGGEGRTGILGSGRGAVVVMPTSTGKTRVAEIAIADALEPDAPTTAIYIAPTRALVAQVEAKLSGVLGMAGYPVTTSTGAYEVIPGLEEVLLSDVRVLVTTPEKLDLLARRGDAIVASCRLFIIDEGDKVDDGERGLRMEFLVRRLRRQYGSRGARFILLSAVLPTSNFEQFARWLDGEVTAVEWRPTRLLEGIFRWTRGDPYLKGKRQYRELVGVIQYPGRFALPGVLRGVEKIGTKKPYPERADVVAALAARYASALPPVLVFSITKAMAEAAAARLTAQLRADGWRDQLPDRHRARLDELAQLAEERFGEGAPLAGSLRVGVGYHHASLPDDLRAAIERALADGDIRALAATSTLAEGIDTPVRAVIFGATTLRMTDARTGREVEFGLTARDFRNIAGRAGRALRETEGHAILVAPSPQERALLDPEALERAPVLSSCFDLAKWLGLEAHQRGIDVEAWLASEDDAEVDLGVGEAAGDVGRLQRAFESAAFAEAIDGDVPEDPLAGTLYTEQVGADDPEEQLRMAGLAAYGRQQGRRVVARNLDRELARIFNQSGFSLQSCELLDAGVRALVEQSDPARWQVVRADGDLAVEAFSDVLRLALVPEEVQPDREGEALAASEQRLTAVTADWTRGVGVRDLLSRHFEAKTPAARRKAVSYLYGEVAQLVPWALSAATRLLKYRLDERHIPLDPELLLLPGYIKQGIDHPVALLATTLGQVDRSVARSVVAKNYPGTLPFNTGDETPWQEFWEEARGWFASLEDEEFDAWTENPATRAAIRAGAGRARTRMKGWKLFLRCPLAGPQYAAGVDILGSLSEGERLVLRREPENPVDRNAIRVMLQDGVELGWVPQRYTPWVAKMLDRGLAVDAEIARVLGPDQPLARRVQLALRRLFV